MVGMTRSMGAEAGVFVPDGVVAVTDTSYEVPGARPFMGQFVGFAHVTVMGAPPPLGTAVKVYDENGPPALGGFAESRAVEAVVAMVEVITGALHQVMRRRWSISFRTSDLVAGTASKTTHPAGGVTNGSELEAVLVLPAWFLVVTVTS